MKVLVAHKPGELRVIEMEKPRPGPRETLIKVKHCGICATDISIYEGTLNLGEGTSPLYPVRLGHEWSGIVEETGSENWRVKPGDRVISDTGYSCGECEMCLEGQYQNCEKGRAIGTIGECWPGAFAEYMIMPERLVFNVPDNVSLDEAALVEPASRPVRPAALSHGSGKNAAGGRPGGHRPGGNGLRQGHGRWQDHSGRPQG